MILLLLLTTLANAWEVKKTSPDFKTAKSESSFFRFEIDAKKLGLFSSTVEGYAKTFSASASVHGDKIEKARVSIPVKEISTDLYARDDQMWNFCFEEKTYPEIRIDLEDTKLKPGEEKKLPAKMQIRGKVKPIAILMKRSESGEVFSGETALSFSELEIPDPSIGVASVKDAIRVKFQLQENPK